jgi:hypothetical protein
MAWRRLSKKNRENIVAHQRIENTAIRQWRWRKQ